MLHNEHADIKFTGGIIEVGDEIRWIRKDFADSHPGNECAAALAAGLSTTSDPKPDHGGVVYDNGGEPYSEVILVGQVDTVDPLTTTNQEDTGTVCFSLSLEPHDTLTQTALPHPEAHRSTQSGRFLFAVLFVLCGQERVARTKLGRQHECTGRSLHLLQLYRAPHLPSAALAATALSSAAEPSSVAAPVAATYTATGRRVVLVGRRRKLHRHVRRRQPAVRHAILARKDRRAGCCKCSGSKDEL